MASTFVVVGASVAGATVADTLRSEGFDGRVVLVGAEPHPPYQRPPLSKEVLLGTADPASSALRPEPHYADQGIELLLGRRATRVLPAERAVELDDGRRLVVDAVALCTGGRPRRLEVAGADLDGVVVLRTRDDAADLAARLATATSVVVVGAGFVGAEVAAAARVRGLAVTLLEVAPTPLARALGPEIGEVYAEIHRSQGVDLRTGTGVARVEGRGRVERVVTTAGEEVAADVVVVGVGLEPAVEVAAASGAQLGDGIAVDELCRTSIGGVFAAGDVAERPSARLGRRCRIEHIRGAEGHAAACARSMLGRGRPYDEVPWFWSDQYGRTLQVAGHPDPHDELTWRGDPGQGSFVAFYRRGGTVRAAVGVDRLRDTRAALSLIERDVPVGAEVLSDESVDLRRLARPTKASV